MLLFIIGVRILIKVDMNLSRKYPIDAVAKQKQNMLLSGKILQGCFNKEHMKGIKAGISSSKFRENIPF